MVHNPGFIVVWLVSLQMIWQCQQLVCHGLPQEPRSLRLAINPVPLDYKIPKFAILLENTPHKITDDMVAAILSPILEETLFDSLGGVQTQSHRLLLAQAYVEEEEENGEGRRRRLNETLYNDDTMVEAIQTNATVSNNTVTNGDIKDTNNTTNDTNTATNTDNNTTAVIPTTKIIVKGGRVSFKRTPPLEKVPEVIEDGINYKLIKRLPQDQIWGSITKVTFVHIATTTTSPLDPTLPQEDSYAPDEVDTPPSSPNDDKEDDPTITTTESSWFDDLPWINVIAGPIVILLGLALIFVARRSRQQQQQQHQQLKDTSFETQETSADQHDDDDDNMTTATTETQNFQYLAKSQYLASEETFERNSRLAIKKDMLESDWFSGRLEVLSETASETSSSKGGFV